MRVELPVPDADESAHSDALTALIRNEIAARGPIPFSRYMELCLYAPGLGYYSAGKTKFGATACAFAVVQTSTKKASVRRNTFTLSASRQLL